MFLFGHSVKGDPTSGFIRSQLYVREASPSDSGVYSCWYGNYTKDTVTVHVLAGESGVKGVGTGEKIM